MSRRCLFHISSNALYRLSSSKDFIAIKKKKKQPYTILSHHYPFKSQAISLDNIIIHDDIVLSLHHARRLSKPDLLVTSNIC